MPYSPIAAIVSPMSANAATRTVRNRAGAVAVAMMPSSGLIADTATVGSTDATIWRSVDARLTSGAVRTVRNVEGQGACGSDQYTWSPGAASIPEYFTSATTPTTVASCAVVSRYRNFGMAIVWPSGSASPN